MRKKIYAIATAILGFGLVSNSWAEKQVYQVVIDNLWITATHGQLPFQAHFSWFGGGTHNAQADFWSVGEPASAGMVQMAETGVTTLLRQEIEAERLSGNADVDINENHWFCPPEITEDRCGPDTFEINVDSDYPLVTLVSMLGPTPDWFVGVDSLPLFQDGQFRDVTVDLYPYDGGTRSANMYAVRGPMTTPPEPISLITAASGQIITPQRLGTISFTRVDPLPAMCNGEAITVNLGSGELPTSGDDVILGTSESDTINALGGNDTICALGGDDIVKGGSGDDWIDGGADNDQLFGNSGEDSLFGDDGNDAIRGGGSNDEIFGEDGDDTLLGQGGDDRLDGGDGDDFVNGSSGNDWIDGGDGVDNLRGGQGNDVVNTGSGATVGTPSTASGGAGDDEINGGADADDLRGGSGIDTINGNGGNDVIRGNADGDTINGGAGDDDLRGGQGDDTLNGESGDDFLAGGGGNLDLCDGGAGNGDLATASCETVSGVQ